MLFDAARVTTPLWAPPHLISNRRRLRLGLLNLRLRDRERLLRDFFKPDIKLEKFCDCVCLLFFLIRGRLAFIRDTEGDTQKGWSHRLSALSWPICLLW